MCKFALLHFGNLFCLQNNKVLSKLQYVFGKMNRSWFKFIVEILNDYGLSFISYQQNVNIQCLKKTVFHILLDQFKQWWNSEMYNSSANINYRMISVITPFSLLYGIK